MTDSNENPQKKKRSPREWESAVEKQIRESMERGEFKNLSGEGKPQDLSVNPFVPEEMRQAFRILQNAGAAPEWIEQDKEIRAEKMALTRFVDLQVNWLKERQARLKHLAPDRLIAEHELLTQSRQQIVGRYRARATALNRLIDTYNLKKPDSAQVHTRMAIDHAIEKILNAKT